MSCEFGCASFESKYHGLFKCHNLENDQGVTLIIPLVHGGHTPIRYVSSVSKFTNDPDESLQ